jgi:hypothetical protein
VSQIITLLDDGWTGKLPSLGYVQTVAGLSNSDAAKLCGVSPETYRRWRTDRKPPLYAWRLLTIMAGYVPWTGWEHWFYNRFDQTLNKHDLKDGFAPGQIWEFVFLRHRYKAQSDADFPESFPLVPYIDKPKEAAAPAGRRAPFGRSKNASPVACGRPLFGLSGRNVHRLRKYPMVGQGANTPRGIDYAK